MKLNNRGFLFGFVGVVPSVIWVISILGVTYTFQPSVLHNFRTKKAVEMCEVVGEEGCQEMVESLTKEELLDYIKDDTPAVIRTNGGNFVGGNMNG